MQPISKLTAAVLLLVTLFSATPSNAQGINSPTFKLDQRLPNALIQVVQYQPPYKLSPKKQVLPKIFKAPTVVVYVIPGHAASEAAALKAVKESESWKNVQLVIALRGLNQGEVDKALQWIESNKITVPVIVDQSMEVALGLRAVQVPSFAMVDENAVLKIRKVGGFNKLIEPGKSFAAVIAEADAGKSIPVADGQMREDTRLLVGQKIDALSVDPAPYSAVQSPAKIGPGTSEKPTLVVFWIATCPHCQREMPRIHEWWSKHKSEIRLVTITRTETAQIRNHTTKYLDSRNIANIPVYSGSGSAYSTFKIEGIPTWAMLHPDGTVVAAHVGEDTRLYAALDAALAKAKP